MKKIVESKILLIVLCLEDDLNDAELANRILVKEGYLVSMDIAKSEKEFVDFLKGKDYDIILADNSVMRFDASAALKVAQTLQPEIPFICVSGTIGEEKAIELIKQGATDYVLKDRLGRLPFSLQRALKEKEIQKNLKQAEEFLVKEYKKYHELVDSISDVFFALDNNLKYTYWNKACETLTGISSENAIGKSFKDIFPENKSRKQVEDLCLQVIESEKPQYGIITYPNNDNIIHEISAYPNIDGVSVFVKDITHKEQAEKKLQKSELKYRSLIESSSDAIFCVDDKGQYQFVNHLFASTFGKTTDYFIGKTYWDVYDKEHADMRYEATKRLFKTGKSESFEVEVPLPDKTLYFLATTNPIKDETGKVILNLTHAADITELKKTQLTLNDSYQFNLQIIKSALEGIIVYDLNLKYQVWNPFMENLTGLPASEVIGKHPLDLFPFLKDAGVISILEKALNGEKNIGVDFPFTIPATGRTGWASDTTSPLYNIKNEIIGAISTVRDITERKQAEEVQQNWNMQFTKLSQNAPGLIFQFTRRLDGTYYVPIASEGIKEIFGCSPEDVLEDFSPIAKVIYPDDFDRVVADIEYSAKHLNFFTCEFRVQIKGNPIQWIYSKSRPEKLADGTITWYGFNSDITESKSKELELIKAKEKAEESDRLKYAFLTNMSHEIRTPMNGILGFTELLKEPNLSTDDQKDFIQTIQISGERMLNTINNIVDVSKIESGLMNLVIDETNINKKIEFTYKFFKPEVEKKGLQFIVKNALPIKDAVVNTDNEKVYGILTNLIKNAIKFTYEGSIEFGYVIKSDIEPAELEFYVKDTGVGIPKNQQQVIFERFRQGSESHNRGYEGSGLGLSICKSYVEILGGKIWVESEEGKGSIFYFTIPYNPVSKESNPIQNAVSLEQNEVQMKNLKILIVEDDEVSYSMLKRNIQKIGKEVLHAITGVEAIEACRSNPELDLVLMDIRMPIMDGLEATRQIRQFNKDVIIIAQTAFAFAGDSEKAIEAGCNEYISKPINMTLLFELVKKHVNK